MKDEDKTNEQLIDELIELRQMEQTSDKQFREFFENAPGYCYMVTPEGTIFDVNKAAIETLGYEKGELIGKLLKTIYAPESLPKMRQLLSKWKETGELKDEEMVIITKEENRRIVLLSANTVKDKDGRILYSVSLQKDITERKRAEEEIKKSHQLNALLLDSIPHPAMLIRTNRTVIAANSIALEVGAKIGEPCWREFAKSMFIRNGENKCWYCMADEAMAEKEGKRCEVEAFERLWDTWWIPLEEDIYLHYAIDITERVKAEEQIKASLAEKEVLLREIHHRVKNNMQVISSLLNLQEGYIDDEKYSGMFQESKNRIVAMALVHDRLYQSENLASINFPEYISSLASTLFQAYRTTGNIALKMDVEDVSIGIDSAIPCGLILNELISNSLKHAFPDGRDGEIRIDLRSDSDDNITLIVGNNGVEFPEDLDWKNIESLGLQLVNILTQQLHGTIEIDKSNGTAFEIKWHEGRT